MTNTHRDFASTCLALFGKKDRLYEIKYQFQSYLLPKEHFVLQLILGLQLLNSFEDRNEILKEEKICFSETSAQPKLREYLINGIYEDKGKRWMDTREKAQLGLEYWNNQEDNSPGENFVMMAVYYFESLPTNQRKEIYLEIARALDTIEEEEAIEEIKQGISQKDFQKGIIISRRYFKEKNFFSEKIFEKHFAM